MTLVLRTAKGAVSFEWTDDDAETVVRIEPTDPDEVMLRKLKRVIALVEGEQAPPTAFSALAQAAGTPAAALATPQTGNGWAAFAAPEIPEGADYELMPPEGQE
ncbi:hypothetical protein [Streptomyces sp. t39]|uniref:hypothetical protein n=1 Tax=Streptomyces sp. t39 TaxID=1828156 RepID=UPI0011CDDF32|nr:hypothetical protein [Streptomyces sp. t39]TXS35082.1 hypothetical protein EAO77_37945 [Streptomyces sp. t39]